MLDIVLQAIEAVGTLLMGLGSIGLVWHQKSIKADVARLNARLIDRESAGK